MTDQATTPEATQGPAGEQWLTETLDEVFLTPRVVDERAFEELSGALKTLVRDAAGQSRALISTTGEVKLLSDQLREATKELQQRVDTAVRVIPTLDQRVAKAEQVLDITGKELAAKVTEMREVASRGVDREKLAAQVRVETAGVLERVLQEQIVTVRERMNAVLGEIQATADSQSAAVIERIQGAQQRLEQTLAQSEQKAIAIAERLDAMIAERLEKGNIAAERIIQRIAEAANSPTDQVREAVAKLEGTAVRCNAAQAAIDTAVNDAGLRLGAAIGEADRRAEALAVQAKVRVTELREQAIEVVEIASKTNAEEILDTVKEAVAAAEQAKAAGAELRELVARGDELARRCEDSERGVEALINRSAEVKDELSSALTAATGNIEGLALRLSEVKAQYEELARRGEGEGGIQTQVREMGTWLGQLLTQGDMIGRGLDRLIKQAGPVIERLEKPTQGA